MAGSVCPRERWPDMAMTSAQPARAGLAGALRSEFTKIRSVRSTYWTLLALVIVTIGIGALASAGAAARPGELGPGFDPTQQSLAGLYVGQLVIVVLGALTISSEYSTGMVRTSLTALPRRGLVFAAKGAVFGAVALVTGLVASFASFFIGQALMSGQHIGTTLGQPHVLRAVIGGGDGRRADPVPRARRVARHASAAACLRRRACGGVPAPAGRRPRAGQPAP